MFEFSFVKKYLTPKKKQLSVSLITLLSVAIISVVVWLVIVFLSITEGIESNWLKKLTALNAPLRITPTQHYFSSYYYTIDQYASASNYTLKTLSQKIKAAQTDPYDPSFDAELPHFIKKPDLNEKNALKDPVKQLIGAIEKLKTSAPELTYQDVELSGGLLRLELIQEPGLGMEKLQKELTHVCYLASFPEKNPFLKELILPPTVADLNHLFYLAFYEGQEEFLPSLLKYVHIQSLKTKNDIWRIQSEFLPSNTPLKVEPYSHMGEISHLIIPDTPSPKKGATLEKRDNILFLKTAEGIETEISPHVPLFTYGFLKFNVLESIKTFPLSFNISSCLQGRKMQGIVSMEGLEMETISFENTPSKDCPWASLKQPLPTLKGKSGILLPKQFKDSSVKLGDSGSLSYLGSTPSMAQEMRIPVYIAGFYDPGIMAVGSKCILVPPSITQTINASEGSFSLEKSESGSLLVWFPRLKDTQKLKSLLVEELNTLGIAPYWKVQSYEDYDFAKDLMQQFQSDKYLFTLIGILILLVACTNIISLLVLLVSDKKKEIGILLAMGAKKWSIGAIFASSGALLGLFGCLLGIFLAMLTLKNIHFVAALLSALQGHEAFNVHFFGHSLPSTLSTRALYFAAIATPLIAFLSGLIPAIKAARLSPSETLRSE